MLRIKILQKNVIISSTIAGVFGLLYFQSSDLQECLQLQETTLFFLPVLELVTKSLY